MTCIRTNPQTRTAIHSQSYIHCARHPRTSRFFQLIFGRSWYFNYFFYNRRLRRVAFFTCRAVSKLVLASVKPDEVLSDDDGQEAADGVGDYDEQVFEEMEA